MRSYPRLMSRVFNTPVMVDEDKALEIANVCGAIGSGIQVRPSREAREAAAEDRRRALEARVPGEVSRRGDLLVTQAGIAVIDIAGTLVHRSAAQLQPMSAMMSYGEIGAAFEDAVTDPAVKAVILDIESGGGEVMGVFDLVDMMVSARGMKPVWAVADEFAASAAYAIASAADRILVPRTGAIGSIGVRALHVDVSERDAMEGFKFTTIFAGARKNDGDPHSPLGAKAAADIQADVDRVYDLFVETVAANRSMTVKAVRETEAALFRGLAGEAVKAGLADAVMPFADAFEELTSKVDGPQNMTFSAASAAPSPGVEEETTMSSTEDRTATAVETAADSGNTATVVDLDAARSEGEAAGRALSMEITDLCELAGCPERASEFMRAGTPVADVRAQLVDARATADADATDGAHTTATDGVKPGALAASMASTLKQRGMTPREVIHG